MAEKKDTQFMYVEAGPELEDGQVALIEADPAHPWAEGGNQVRIVKSDPQFSEGYVGTTPHVLQKLSRSELVRKDAPSGTPEPSLTAPRVGRTATASTTAAPLIPEGQPSDAWTVAQMEAYAAEHGIDLNGARSKDDRLAKFAAAKVAGSGGSGSSETPPI